MTRRQCSILSAAFLLLLGAGCTQRAESKARESGPTNAAPTATAPVPAMETVARIHWLGMKRLATETNAAGFMRIWNLRETARLEKQTLDKLASAPWRLLRQPNTGRADLPVGSGAREKSQSLQPRGSAALPARATPVVGRADLPVGSEAEKSAAHEISRAPQPRGSAALPSAGTSTLANSNPANSQLATHNSQLAESASLRPLLDDMVADESYLEIRAATNQPGQLVFAIRLDGARAALWQTNLAEALESLTGIRPQPTADGRGWSLKKHDVPDLIQLARAGDWTLLGAAEETNGLFDEVRAKIGGGQLPFGAETNEWLTADLDLPRIGEALGLKRRLPANFPKIALTAVGDGTNVHTHAELDFSRALPLALEPWEIPTNLVDSALTSFTAVRGIRPWLDSWDGWKELGIGPAPNQVCCWAAYGLQMQTLFAAPLPDASNVVSELTDRVLEQGGPWFARHDLAGFARSTTYNGLEWKGLPYMSPFLRSWSMGKDSFVYGGFFPNSGVNPISGDLLQKALHGTNLVYHDWEVTGTRVTQWLYMSQFMRFVCRKAQLPFQSAALLWLKALEPELGDSITAVTQTAPNQLTFDRTSTIGLTGIELQVLADWLESPRFPVGLHTFLAPPPAQTPGGPAPASPAPAAPGAKSRAR